MPIRRYSKRQDLGIYYFYDDFVGSNYDNRWWTARGTGGSLSVSGVVGGILRVRATANNNYELYQNDLCDFSAAKTVVLTCRFYFPSTASMDGGIGLEAASPTNATDWLCIKYSSTFGTANWRIESASGGSSTTTDTGIAVDTNWHEARIEVTSSLITYFLDGRLLGTISSPISTALLQPYVGVVSRTGATKDVNVDWMEVYGQRE